MKVDVIGVYPMYGEFGKYLVCSVHIYLRELNIDLRGYNVTVKPGESLISDPCMSAIDNETGNLVTFPVVGFIGSRPIDLVKDELIKQCTDLYNKPETFKDLKLSYLAYQQEIFDKRCERIVTRRKLKDKADKKKFRGPAKKGMKKISKPFADRLKARSK